MQRSHRNLKAWQEAVILVEVVYRVTRTFPKEEIFGLVSQMRRAATSVPANIAEGAARNGTKELLRFLGIASGSLSELDTRVEIATRLDLMQGSASVRQQIDKVSTLVLALAKSLKAKAG